MHVYAHIKQIFNISYILNNKKMNILNQLSRFQLLLNKKILNQICITNVAGYKEFPEPPKELGKNLQSYTNIIMKKI